MDNETQILLNELCLLNIDLLRTSYEDIHRFYRLGDILGELLKKLYPGRSPQNPRSEQFRYDYRDYLLRLNNNLIGDNFVAERPKASNLPDSIPDELFEL